MTSISAMPRKSLRARGAMLLPSRVISKMLVVPLAIISRKPDAMAVMAYCS